MSARLQGKTTVVTGGASGIGLAIARGFAEEGALVCVADVAQARCESVAAEIGRGSFGHALDVRDRRSIDALVADVVASAGGIDSLVNCAGDARGPHIHAGGVRRGSRLPRFPRELLRRGSDDHRGRRSQPEQTHR